MVLDYAFVFIPKKGNRNGFFILTIKLISFINKLLDPQNLRETLRPSLYVEFNSDEFNSS